MTGAYYTTKALELIAHRALNRISPDYLYDLPQAVPIEMLIEKVYSLNIEYHYLTANGTEIGRMIYDDGYTTRFDPEKDEYEFVRVQAGTMMIDASLLEDEKNTGRLRFTLAHELAHWMIHQNVYAGTSIAATMLNENEKENQKCIVNSIEWQANQIAQAILMPNGQTKRAYYSTVRQTHGRKDETIVEMSRLFEVSRQAMKIRLKQLGLIP